MSQERLPGPEDNMLPQAPAERREGSQESFSILEDSERNRGDQGDLMTPG